MKGKKSPRSIGKCRAFSKLEVMHRDMPDEWGYLGRQRQESSMIGNCVFGSSISGGWKNEAQRLLVKLDDGPCISSAQV